MTILVQSRTILAKLNAQTFVALGLAATFTALFGVYWDVTWHATIGRDSFWIPPHLLVYTGVGLFLLAALGGFGLVWQGSASLRPALTNPTGLGFAIAALGPIIQITAAPLDDLWHRLYGLDVTIWSPPHLMGIAGGMVGIYGLLAALAVDLPKQLSRPVWRGLTGSETLSLLLWGAALSLSMFALAEFDFHLDERDPLFYPLLAGVLAAISLLGTARYLGRPGAATVVALIYTLFRSLVVLIIWSMGLEGHFTPPVFVLAPALAIDLALWRSKGRSILLATLLSGPALLLGEWGYQAIFGAPAWEPLQVVASLAVVTLVIALGGLAGDRLGALLQVEQSQKRTHEKAVRS